MRRATPQEKAEYQATNPVYPLHGWVMVDGKRCAVENCYMGDDGPRYEVMAPAGLHFTEGITTNCRDSLHSLLCLSVADLRERVRYETLVPCTEETA